MITNFTKPLSQEDGVGNAIKAIYRDMEYAKTLVQKRESLAYKSSGDGSEDTDNDDDEEDVEVEEWTLVDNDSDPESANPKAMMQPEQARSSGGRRRASPDY